MGKTVGIKIVEMKAIDGEKPLKAYASIQLGNWIIHDWRVIQQPGQKAWVSVPQSSWTGRDGRIKYRNLITIPGEWRKRIEEEILKAWEGGKGDGQKDR
jgi:DNA-binding cell septation regulator SpoVG